MAPRRVLTDSPFDTLEKTFDLLVTGPRPLALDGTGLSGLPNRRIPLGELKAILLHPSMSFAARDAVINSLAARARDEGGSWTIGLAGVLLPGLRRAAWPLVKACPGRRDDIEAEMLVALIAAVGRESPGRERLAARLCWLARAGANQLLRAELAERAHPTGEPMSCAPPRPWGHPDLVLARAVEDGVINADDAELIGATRMEGSALEDLARDAGISYWALNKRRTRAESALVEWLTGDECSPFRFVQKDPALPCSSHGGRPRHGRSMDRRPGKRRSTHTSRR